MDVRSRADVRIEDLSEDISFILSFSMHYNTQATVLQDELIYQIRQSFGFEPTLDQNHALTTFAAFMTDP